MIHKTLNLRKKSSINCLMCTVLYEKCDNTDVASGEI